MITYVSHIGYTYDWPKKKLSLKKINYIGNLKFAKNSKERFDRINEKLKKEFKRKNIWVASSTHSSEEILCAKTHLKLKKKYKKDLTCF